MGQTVLVVDDEVEIADLVELYLKNEGFAVRKFYNGHDALECVRTEELDLAILDVMLPDIDGFTLCARIREEHFWPIIMLTAKVEDIDKIMGLTIGADDYITKPFNPLEVIARVKAQLRRYAYLGGIKSQPPKSLQVGDIELDDDAKQVTLCGEPVAFTPTEYEILKLLMQNPGKVFSSKEIYSKIWNDAPIGAEGTIAVHIRHIREKLEIDPGNPRYLKVVWGKGYKLNGGKNEG
mgnify:CR=1 FL=1